MTAKMTIVSKLSVTMIVCQAEVEVFQALIPNAPRIIVIRVLVSPEKAKKTKMAELLPFVTITAVIKTKKYESKLVNTN